MLGPQHPDTAQSLNNLGGLLQDMGDLASARPYYECALAIREQVLGPQHPATAQSLWWMAELARREGEVEQARKLYARALAIFTERLGPQHPNTQAIQRTLAGLNALQESDKSTSPD